jgi:hypothetical protein
MCALRDKAVANFGAILAAVLAAKEMEGVGTDPVLKA